MNHDEEIEQIRAMHNRSVVREITAQRGTAEYEDAARELHWSVATAADHHRARLLAIVDEMKRELDRERARAEKAEAALAFMGDGKGQIHECPTDAPGLTPCCARALEELPHSDRMSANPALVNCDRVRLRDRAFAAEAALTAAREKVKGLQRWDADPILAMCGSPSGDFLQTAEVLAALGVES